MVGYESHSALFSDNLVLLVFQVLFTTWFECGFTGEYMVDRCGYASGVQDSKGWGHT